MGPDFTLGHRLWKKNFPEASETIFTKLLIIGGGVGGLSAGWKLQKSGFDGFLLLEMEKETGGNSRFGTGDISPYPWGAHYVPIPNAETKAAAELLQELGVITGKNGNGVPIYNELHLCADPPERLYRFGQWQEGLVPKLGASEETRHAFDRFFGLMDHYKNLKGNDGKPAFAIPMELSSRDASLLALDSISFDDFLKREGLEDPDLHWYVTYCCRDDFATLPAETSAWAGIHYFASRRGLAANADPHTVLTWPEGNGWIASKLRQKLEKHIRPRCLVYDVRKADSGVEAYAFDAAREKSLIITTESVIFAVPHFICQRLFGLPPDKEFTYAPWMVANLTLSRLPEGRGAALAWDNVIYDSPFLGYVVATHQTPHQKPTETIISYYWPLHNTTREEVMKRSLADWQKPVLNELYRIHPELEGKVTRMDVWLWGHGMVRPVPGFVWGEARQEAARPKPPFFFAHSDLSGFSIFEEAQYRGVLAAEGAMRHLGHRFTTSL
ncbi:MAG: NAD(P)-binding protein [Alphaproteobacteria bacterium]|nr:NAD(P)-binding protein [Alphaproteobacteria bacterium]